MTAALRRPYRQQPSTPAALAGWVPPQSLVWHGGEHTIGGAFSALPSVSRVVGPGGRAIIGTVDASGASIGAPPAPVAQQLTLVAQFRRVGTAAGSNYTALAGVVDGASSRLFERLALNIDGTAGYRAGTIGLAVGNNGTTDFLRFTQASAVTTFGKLHTVAISMLGAYTAEMWLDGAPVSLSYSNGGFGLTSAAGASLRSMAIAGYNNVGVLSRSRDNEVYLYARLPQRTGSGVLRELSLDPWGTLFEPRRIWVPMSSGGSAEQHESGGSAAAVVVSAGGAGVGSEAAQAGSASHVGVLSTGAGASHESLQDGASATIVVSAVGAGIASSAAAAGGSASAVVVEASGTGQAAEAASGGESAGVEVTPAGAGQAAETAQGGAASAVAVSAVGAGVSDGAAAGGSSAHVLVTPAGTGLALEIDAGGAAAPVRVSAAGGGIAAIHAGGSAAQTVVSAAGAGQAQMQAAGGSASPVIVHAQGAGYGPGEGARREIWRASSRITTTVRASSRITTAVHASSHITAQVLRTSTIYLQDDT